MVVFTERPADAGEDQAAELPPHLAEVREALETYIGPDAEGKAWQVTEGNRLDTDWLIETPDCWGTAFDSCAVEEPGVADSARTDGTQQLLDAISSDLSAATASIDITSLAECGLRECPGFEGNYGFPTGAFHDAIVQGLSNAGKLNDDRESVQVRILVGDPGRRNLGSRDASKYTDRLIRDLNKLDIDAVPRLKITITVQNVAASSWNHSKIIAVDGRTAIVGGQNLWSSSYDGPSPVADVTMRLSGPAAESAQLYVDELWSSTAGQGPCNRLYTVQTGGGGFVCPTTHTAITSNEGDTTVLAVGSRGRGMSPDFAGGSSAKAFAETRCPGARIDAAFLGQNPDLLALWTLIESAEETIYISAQQLNGILCSGTLGVRDPVDNELFDILADKLEAGVRVRIVVTGITGVSGSDFVNQYTGSRKTWLPEIVDPLLSRVSPETLCSNLQLAPFRHEFGSHGWANEQRIKNHAKVVMVDEAAFYIGSRNLYPAQLQEFGYMVEDEAAANDIVSQYFDPMWEASRSAATIDSERGLCHTGPSFEQYVAAEDANGNAGIWTCESTDGSYCSALAKDESNELGLPEGRITALSVFYVDGVRHVWAVPDGDGSRVHVQVGDREAYTVALPCINDCDLPVTSFTTTVNADGSILQAYTRNRTSTDASKAWTEDQSQYLRFLTNDDRIDKVTTVLPGEEGTSWAPPGITCPMLLASVPYVTEDEIQLRDPRNPRCFNQLHRPTFRQLKVYEPMQAAFPTLIVNGPSSSDQDPSVVDVLEGSIISQALAPTPDGTKLAQANWHEGAAPGEPGMVRLGFYRVIPFDPLTGIPDWDNPERWQGPITESTVGLTGVSGQTQVFRP